MLKKNVTYKKYFLSLIVIIFSLPCCTKTSPTPVKTSSAIPSVVSQPPTVSAAPSVTVSNTPYPILPTPVIIPTSVPSLAPPAGTWTIEQGIRFANQTSNCTIILSDGTYRTYLNGGKTSTSTDGITWTPPVMCRGLDPVNSWNPSVIYFNNKYIMIYEKQTKENNVQIRRLHRAVSTDGINFTLTTGNQANSSVMSPLENDHNFLSVPDMISLNNTTIRMYFVAGGMGIDRATSTDEGLTWAREGKITISGLVQGLPYVDPDIIRVDDGRYQIFFSTNPDKQPGNMLINTRIRSALSTDGENFTLDPGDRLSTDNTNMARVDADVVKLPDGKYRMYFGEFNSGTPGPGAMVNLKSALSP